MKKNERKNDWISFIMKEKLIEAVLKRPPHTHTHSVNTRANAIYSLLISLWIKLSDEMRKKSESVSNNAIVWGKKGKRKMHFYVDCMTKVLPRQKLKFMLNTEIQLHYENGH